MWPFFRAAKACLPLVTFIRLGFDWLRQIMIEHQVLLNQDNGPVFLSHEPLFTLPWEKKGIQNITLGENSSNSLGIPLVLCLICLSCLEASPSCTGY